MGNFDNLKQSVVDAINANGNEEITGDVLQGILNSMIDNLGANAGVKWIDAMINTTSILPITKQEISMNASELLLENGSVISNVGYKTSSFLENTGASAYRYFQVNLQLFNAGFANVVYYDNVQNKVKDYLLDGSKVIGVPPGYSVKICVPNSYNAPYEVLTYTHTNVEVPNISEVNYQNWLDLENSTNLTNADVLTTLKAIKMLHLEVDSSIDVNTMKINTFCGATPALGSNYASKIEIRDESESPLVHFRLESIFNKDNIDILVGESSDGLRKGVAVVDWSLLPSDTFQFFGQALLRIKKNLFNPIASIAKDVYDLKISTGVGQDKKKILVIGTSIPQGSTYPINASKANNYFAYNKAIGSSGICLNTGILGNGRDGKDLSETIAEKEARYNATVDAATMEQYRNYSWERVIKPYLDGTIDSVDAIWFDHGYNDRNQIYAELANINSIDWSLSGTHDRSTFSGAFKYLINEIFKLNPYCKIIISGYLESQSDNSKRGGAGIKQMHEAISTAYGFPFMRVFDYTGFSFNHVPNTTTFIADYNAENGTSYNNYFPDAGGNITFLQLFMPDTVHPYSDRAGKTNLMLDAIYTKLLKNLI